MNDTLILVEKKKWYDMIASGEKKEEYREITSYWVTRLLGVPELDPDGDINDILRIKISKGHRAIPRNIYQRFHCGDLVPLPFRNVRFCFGYEKDRPETTMLIKGITIGKGNPAWGAEPGKDYIIIKI